MARDFADKTLNMPIYQHGIVIERLNGVAHTNVPHLVVHHSPAGYDFGYGGSGAADLALNILEWKLHQEGHAGDRIKCFDGHCFRAAWDMHQDFKREFLAENRQIVRISLQDLTGWMARHRTPGNPQQRPDSPAP